MNLVHHDRANEGRGRPCRVGIGAMPLSTIGRPERSAAIDTLHAAFDAGVRLVDTADAYCLSAADTGHSELLVAEAIAGWTGCREDIVVATKGGHIRDDQGGWHTSGSPEHLVRAASASRDRLEVDAIPLYYFHRPDPAVDFARSVEALASLLADGVVRSVGLSNVDIEQLEIARAIVPIAAVQNSFSPYDSSSRGVVAWCDDRSVPFVAWAPLGGAGRAPELGSDRPTRLHADIARTRGVSVAQVVLAWILSQSPMMSVVPGARRPASIVDAVAADDLVLTDVEVDLLDASVLASTPPDRSV